MTTIRNGIDRKWANSALRIHTAGLLGQNAQLFNRGTEARFQTANQNANDANFKASFLLFEDETWMGIDGAWHFKQFAFSVRCIKD
jgi:hypothetical protein